MTPLERDIHTQISEINNLQGEQKRIRSDIALYSARIERAPQVQQQLEERTKGYDVLQQQYRDYQSKVESARGAQTIEEAQKGEQFEVIERAIPPALPVQPIPLVVVGLGITLGLLLFAGPVVALGLLRPTVDSEELLRLFVKVPVLVTIPRIQTDAMRRRTIVERGRNVVLSSVSVVVLAAVLIVMYAR
jgi:hypothetical protein